MSRSLLGVAIKVVPRKTSFVLMRMGEVFLLIVLVKKLLDDKCLGHILLIL